MIIQVLPESSHQLLFSNLGNDLPRAIAVILQ